LKKTTINIYCDESEIKNITNENWTYYGVLVVPTEKTDRLFTELINSRCIINNNWDIENCELNCGYHMKNNSEIHYTRITQDHKYRIASKWIDILLKECIKNEKRIYLNILGLDRTLINKKYWNHFDNPNDVIYSKFLFSIFKSIKYYFPDSNTIKINKIVHDPASFQNNKNYYYEQLFTDLANDKRFELDSKIEFVDSDHRISSNNMDSHFLQLIDLILGLTVNYIHCNSKKEHKLKLTNQISPLIKRIIEAPYNPNSKYNYHRQKSIKFFPKQREFYRIIQNLDGGESEIVNELFYHEKKCLFEEYYNQKTHITLDKFF